jgi:hypothetical protein
MRTHIHKCTYVYDIQKQQSQSKGQRAVPPHTFVRAYEQIFARTYVHLFVHTYVQRNFFFFFFQKQQSQSKGQRSVPPPIPTFKVCAL